MLNELIFYMICHFVIQFCGDLALRLVCVCVCVFFCFVMLISCLVHIWDEWGSVNHFLAIVLFTSLVGLFLSDL